MASVPLILSGQPTGLTITASVVRVLPSVAAAVAVSVPESSTQGTYVGTFVAASSSTYTVTFTDASGKKCGDGEFSTDSAGNEIVAGSNSADSPATQAMQVAVSTKLDRRISQATPYGAYRNVYFVRTDGNDANDGLTPATAKKTVYSALSLAAQNDLVLVGPGTFNEGSNALGVFGCVTLRGSGKFVTQITGTNANFVLLGTGAKIESLSIIGTRVGYQFPITCTSSGFDFAELSDLYISGDTDGIMISNLDDYSTNTCRLLCRNLLIETKFDCINTGGNLRPVDIELHNCDLRAMGPSVADPAAGISRALSNYSATIRMYGGSAIAANGGALRTSAVETNRSQGIIELYGVALKSSGTQGAIYDIANSPQNTGGSIQVAGCAYDATKVFGAVASVPIHDTVATLAASQPLYAPAKAGVPVTLDPNEHTAISTAVQAGILDDLDGEAVEQALADKIAATDLQLGSITIQGIAQASRAEIDANSTRLATLANDQASLATAVSNVAERTSRLPDIPAARADVQVTVNPTTISNASVDAIANATVDTLNADTTMGGIRAKLYALPTDIWGNPSRTLTSFGSLVGDIAAAVWSAATRTLSAFGFTVKATDENGASLATQAQASEIAGGLGNLATTDQITAVLAGGVGTRAVSVTVVDGNGAPISGASVSFVNGPNQRRSNSGDDGTTAFSVNDGTWLLAITAEGYAYTPTSHDVASNTAIVAAMQAKSLPSPANADSAIAYLYAYDVDNQPAAGQQFEFALVKIAGGTAGSWPMDIKTALSDDSGLVSFSAVKGARYRGRRWKSDSEGWGPWQYFDVGQDDQFPIPVLYGRASE